MGLALLTAARATCVRRRVGAVFLNHRGHVLSTGYNGVASGQPHCNHVTGYRLVDINAEMTENQPVHGHACPGARAPSGQGLDACQAIHAEQNALLQCKDIYDLHAAFVTASPCMTCTKLLMNTSCQRVYFLEDYPHREARDLWVGSGREWIKMESEYLQNLQRML